MPAACVLTRADQYPSATVVGTDLSPIQPEWVPPNCIFEIDDVTLDWTFPPNHFDFVHVRELFGCIPNWDFFFQQAYEHIAPGGWIEVVEHGVHPRCDDGTMPDDHFFHTWGENVVRIGNSSKWGKTFSIWEEAKERMERAGFVDVTEVTYQWPMNGWPEDRKLKDIGRWNQLRLHEGVESFMLRLLTLVDGVSDAHLAISLVVVPSQVSLTQTTVVRGSRTALPRRTAKRIEKLQSTRLPPRHCCVRPKAPTEYMTLPSLLALFTTLAFPASSRIEV